MNLFFHWSPCGYDHIYSCYWYLFTRSLNVGRWFIMEYCHTVVLLLFLEIKKSELFVLFTTELKMEPKTHHNNNPNVIWFSFLAPEISICIRDSQFGQHRIPEQRLFVAGQEKAFVGAEVFNQCVCCVSVLRTKSVTVIHFQFPCLDLHEAFTCASLFTYRLNHSILDPPVVVLLHPGILYNHSSSLLSCLSVEWRKDQFGNNSSVAPQWLNTGSDISWVTDNWASVTSWGSTELIQSSRPTLAEVKSCTFLDTVTTPACLLWFQHSLGAQHALYLCEYRTICIA